MQRQEVLETCDNSVIKSECWDKGTGPNNGTIAELVHAVLPKKWAEIALVMNVVSSERRLDHFQPWYRVEMFAIKCSYPALSFQRCSGHDQIVRTDHYTLLL